MKIDFYKFKLFFWVWAWIGLLVFPQIVEAIDIRLGGQVRPRWEARDRDFNSETDTFHFLSSRFRVNINTRVNDKVSNFIQFQSVNVFGSDRTDSFGSTVETNSSFLDLDESVGIHQGYVVAKGLLNLPLEFKIGRQEMILDGQRIFGNNGWFQEALSHDGVSIWHKGEKHTLMYFFSQFNENGSETIQDSTDDVVHTFWGNYKGILGGDFSAYFVYRDSDTFENEILPDNDSYTLGLRQAGRNSWFDYRVEGYYQFGDADLFGGQKGTERSAFLFGVRIGKKFKARFKPSVAVWYDYVSGDDEDDKVFKAFNPDFGNGHKYYGFMDRFVLLGQSRPDGNSSSVTDTDSMGLQDLALKFSMKPHEKVTVRADLHFFWTAVNAHAGVVPAKLIGERHLGEELDLTLIYHFDPSLTIVGGYSIFAADPLMHHVGGRTGAPNNTDADWGFIMVSHVF